MAQVLEAAAAVLLARAAGLGVWEMAVAWRAAPMAWRAVVRVWRAAPMAVEEMAAAWRAARRVARQVRVMVPKGCEGGLARWAGVPAAAMGSKF